MEQKIKIIFNNRVAENIWNSDNIIIVIILLILKHFIKGNTKSVGLDLLAYVFDVLEKDTEIFDKKNVEASLPWDIPELRTKVILAYEMELLQISKANSKFGFKLTNEGNDLVKRLISEELLPDLNQKIQKLSKIVTESNLKKQHLIL